jgi:hypothetical protein
MSNTITTFDRAACAVLSDDVMAALEAVAAKHGIQIKRGRGTFSGGNFTMKIEASVIGEGGRPETKEALCFQRYAASEGLSPNDLYTEFTIASGTYEIVGFKPRSRKYPILAVKVGDGRTFKFAAETIRTARTRGMSTAASA